MTAFDLDIGIVSEHPAEVMKPGAVTLSAKTLFDIVANLPEPQLNVKKLPNNHAEITCGSASYRIVGMASEEFPKLPKEENAPLVKVSGNTVLEMIKKTSFAISSDETRSACRVLSHFCTARFTRVPARARASRQSAAHTLAPAAGRIPSLPTSIHWSNPWSYPAGRKRRLLETIPTVV